MALPAGAQYGLSAESSRHDREIVFVKLTDAALKAIEDFIRSNRGKVGAAPTIQFLPGNEGKICIPAGSSGQHSASTFHFSLSSNADIEGPQGSFECVRSGGARRLESCGPLPRKMRIHANDDSYEATKNAMAKSVAEEQSKFTRVIKPNQTDIGRRVKLRPGHPLHPSHGGSHAPHASHGGSHAPHASHGGSHAPHALHGSSHAPHAAHPPPAQPGAAGAAGSHAPAPAPAHPAQPQQRPPGNPDLARRPIRERLIQLLALKPFKKPELYKRIYDEGLKDKEKSVIHTILQQISSYKDNCYRLHRHIWNDVNEDWQFYTEDEKRMLKRRKPQNLTPPLSSDSTNSLSPRASPGKRAGDASDQAPGAAKKQRISHYRRAEQRGSPSSGYATAGSGASSGERHVSDNEDERSTSKKDPGYTLSYNTTKVFESSPAKQSSPPPVETNSNEVNETVNEMTAEATEGAVSELNTSDPAENSDEEIERAWPQITSASERRRYKKEFTHKFTEYTHLCRQLAQVATHFSRLEQQLKRAAPNSPSYQDVRNQILEEYSRMQRDGNYQREKRRSQYLHRKLTHIKRMVQDYDAHTVLQMKRERVASAGATQAY